MILSQSNRPVVVIDYQLGNIHSVCKACALVGLDVIVSNDYQIVRDARGVILPGVGAFGDAMSNLRSLKLDHAIRDFVASGRPFLGICLGMQLLFDKSEEFGSHEGLGIIQGTVRRIPPMTALQSRIKVPHVGWNSIESESSSAWQCSLLKDVTPGECMYFVHSYFVEVADPDEVLSWTTYGAHTFCSSVQKGQAFAAQFHPEKSGPPGLSIYRRWAALVNKGRDE